MSFKKSGGTAKKFVKLQLGTLELVDFAPAQIQFSQNHHKAAIIKVIPLCYLDPNPVL